MKNLKDLNPPALTRDELAKIKAGSTNVDCTSVWESCNPNCGHFSTSYITFERCVSSQTTLCSPLEGWLELCGNWNG